MRRSVLACGLSACLVTLGCQEPGASPATTAAAKATAGSMKHVTSADFDATIAQGVTIVEFSADW